MTYQDIGLALSSTNPLILDARGRVPLFFVADGIYRVRLTDKDGDVKFDDLQVPSIGASTSGGGGSAVDPTTVFGTGDTKWLPLDGVVTGWVRINGRTIGSAASGASERANADTQALFIWLYSNFSDTKCPVSGGRTTALADFNANKTIQLLDFRDLTLAGLDSMGNGAKGGLLAANITSGGGDGVNTAAAMGGEANHTLTTAELAAHTHTDTGHTHALHINGTNTPAGGSGNNAPSSVDPFMAGKAVDLGTTDSGTAVLSNTGGGTAHQNMPPFVLGTWFCKL